MTITASTSGTRGRHHLFMYSGTSFAEWDIIMTAKICGMISDPLCMQDQIEKVARSEVACSIIQRYLDPCLSLKYQDIEDPLLMLQAIRQYPNRATQVWGDISMGNSLDTSLTPNTVQQEFNPQNSVPSQQPHIEHQDEISLPNDPPMESETSALEEFFSSIVAFQLTCNDHIDSLQPRV
eukprot:gene15835-21962_t